MNKKEKKEIEEGIQSEGFDYYFLNYVSLSKFQDKELNTKITNLRAAREQLVSYLESKGIECE